MLQDKAFRKDVNALLPPSHRLPNPNADQTASDFEVIYGIVMKATEPLNKSLPFFSRVTLVSAYTSLRLMGYKVGVRQIANNRP
jgi:uncharacterized protein (TIGR04141 family)